MLDRSVSARLDAARVSELDGPGAKADAAGAFESRSLVLLAPWPPWLVAKPFDALPSLRTHFKLPRIFNPNTRQHRRIVGLRGVRLC